LVSIIVATYNGEKYLLQQLQSLAAQTYKDLEIIICDDNSSDGTKTIIEDFASKNKNVSFYFNTKNLGVNQNFEQGFLRATGEFIAIADQDDIWLPNKIEEQMKLFTEEEIVLSHSASVHFSGNILPVKKRNNSTLPFTGNDVKKLLLRNSVSGHNIIFRKSLLTQILPIPEHIFYDWWIVQTAACNGMVTATNKILAYHRFHENNITLQQRNSVYQTVQEYNERKTALNLFLNLKNLSDENRKFIENLKTHFNTLEQQSFSKELFDFYMKNRNTLFYYKRRFLKYFSQKKAAYRMSFKVP
jgi:glycosyltransferase involved in cell wall biosynthesis